MTEEPEQIIISKNRKVKKLSGSMCAVAALLVVILIVYGLFRPVPYHVTATCNEIEVRIWDGPPISFSMIDEDKTEELVDAINATTFRKSLRISQVETDPISMKAQLVLRSEIAPGCAVRFCSTPDRAVIYVAPSDGGELIAVNPNALSDYIVQLLEEATEDAWTFS